MGNHQQLVEQDGIYRQIYDIQTRIEIELEQEIGLDTSQALDLGPEPILVETAYEE